MRLTGGAERQDLLTIEVSISGPTASGDLYAFAFDLLLSDPEVAEYVPGSAACGDALVLIGGQTCEALAAQTGDRVTVGVTKLGAGPGNGVTGQDVAIVLLDFRVLEPGTTDVTMTGSPPADDPAAIDSTPTPITGEDAPLFDTAAARITGS